MNRMLFEFYQGSGKDNRGRSLADMLKMSNYELERSHDIIQWLFPLKELSMHNKAAPLLDGDTIQAIKEDEKAFQNLHLACQRIWDFLVQNYAEKPTWIRRNNHNYLRITRIIKCCKLFDLPFAESFYHLGMHYYLEFPDEIGKETLKYWQDALRSG